MLTANVSFRPTTGYPPTKWTETLSPGGLGCRRQAERSRSPGIQIASTQRNRRGLWSISITGNLRITFRFEAGDVYDADLVGYNQ